MLAEASDEQFELTHMERLDEGLKCIAKEEFDAILSDFGLPDSQGLDTFTRANSLVQDWPIVVLTGLRDETLGLEAVQQGAQDYLVKGHVDANLLARAIPYAIERHRLVAELEQARRQEQWRREQLQRELRSLRRLSDSPQASFRAKAKKKTIPPEKVIKEYTGLIRDCLIDKRGEPSQAAEKAAKEFFDKDLSGKEVIDIHLGAVDIATEKLNQELARKLVEQARFFLLGVMTDLAALYRLGGKTGSEVMAYKRTLRQVMTQLADLYR
jgi:DNA-binding NarL/FixJ family response regulator